MRRRDFIGAGVLAGAAGLVAPVAGRAAEKLLVQVARPQNLATPLELLDRHIIPTQAFFVRSHFGPPALDMRRRLRIEGGKKPLELSLSDLKAFPEVTTVAVLQCAGNGRAFHSPRVPGVQWGHGAMGQASWTGVRLAHVLDKVGVGPEAAWVSLQGADLPPKPAVPPFVRGIPLTRALDPTTLIATKMNGEPLDLLHGAPMRLVTPGWTGDHWVKWLTRIGLHRDEPEGFYHRVGYRVPVKPVEPGAAVPPEETTTLTTFPVKSVIARPTEGQRIRRGTQEVTGVAFSGEVPIAEVEVSIDGGASWKVAVLEGRGGAGTWQVFRHRFEAGQAGRYVAVARASDARGAVQPERATWNPSGYLWNGWHRVTFEVQG
jgi:DMSO/TMAO reductase YedYZ molybdopterin-dependent catalytic subunit